MIMAKPFINLCEAKNLLSELVERASLGEAIVITKGGLPMARLGPLPRKRSGRKPGGGKGRVWMADDFDAPLPADLLAL